MSGVEIVGLVASVIALVEATCKVVNGIRNVQILPPVYAEVATRLPLIQNILESVKESAQKNDSPDLGSKNEAIKSVLESCKLEAEELRDIMLSVAPSSGSSTAGRAKLALRRMQSEGRVRELMKSILEEIQLLSGDRAFSGATAAQVAELSRAIEDILQAKPTTSECTFTHNGLGDQFSNTGDSTQYNNTGGGKQFSAESMTFNGAWR